MKWVEENCNYIYRKINNEEYDSLNVEHKGKLKVDAINRNFEGRGHSEPRPLGVS